MARVVKKTPFQKAMDHMTVESNVTLIREIRKVIKEYKKYGPVFKVGQSLIQLETVDLMGVRLFNNGTIQSGFNFVECLSVEGFFNNNRMRHILYDVVAHYKELSKDVPS